MWSRHGTDLSRPFSDIARAASSLPDAVLDGELVVVLNDGSGVAFDRLQSRTGSRGPRSGADFTVHVALFDVLAVGEQDWRQRPYTERRAGLLHLLEEGPPTLRAVPATEAVVIGVTGRTQAAQALVLGQPHGGRMRAVAVSLPLPQNVGAAVARLLHAAGGEMRELPGTVGGLPGADPVRFLPVEPEVVVEIEVDQDRLEFGR